MIGGLKSEKRIYNPKKEKTLIKAKPTQKINSWVGKKIAMKKKNYRFWRSDISNIYKKIYLTFV